MLGLALSSLPLWLPAGQALGTEVQLTLATGVFALVSTITTGVLSTDAAQLVAPR